MWFDGMHFVCLYIYLQKRFVRGGGPFVQPNAAKTRPNTMRATNWEEENGLLD
jgi:hypothetical protein